MVPASKIAYFSGLLLVASTEKYNVSFLQDSYTLAYQKIFGDHVKSGVLATVPLCYEDGTVSSDATLMSFNGTNAEYFEFLSRRNQSAVNVYFQAQLNQVNVVSEKHQSLSLRIFTNMEWKDCRLRWVESESSAPYIALSPSKLRSLELFQPPIRLAQEVDPQASRFSEKEVQITKAGIVWLTKEYSTTISCKIDIRMYPFDIQLCHLTFEGICDRTLLSLPIDQAFYRDVRQGSSYSLRGFVPSDTWSVSLLPPTQAERRYCVDPLHADYNSSICFVDAQNYRLLLRRHPNYQVVNLMFPAFLVVFISSCVFLVPPGEGDKMGLSVSILLSMFMFTQLMYENMPETGSTLPLLSLYFLFCVALISTSCIYSAVSTAIGSGGRRVPACLAKAAQKFGRVLLFDMPLTHDRCDRFYRGRWKCNRHQEGLNWISSGFAHNVDRVADINADLFAAASRRFRSHCSCKEQTVEPITWRTVAMLLDRVFFVCQSVISVVMVSVFYTRGYLPWYWYEGIQLSDLDKQYICAQRLIQGEMHAHDAELCDDLASDFS